MKSLLISMSLAALVASTLTSLPASSPASLAANTGTAARGGFLSVSLSGKAEVAAAAVRVRMDRFKESLAPVMRGLINDPSDVGRTVRRAIEDKEQVIFNTSIPREAPVNKVRLGVAALSKSRASRELMVKASLEAIQRRSSALKRTLLTLADSSPLAPDSRQLFEMVKKENVFDELVIGLGPQSVAYLQKTTDLAPTKRILAVDINNKPGGTFRDVGGAFALNSTNRANTGKRPRPGEGDLNYIQDLLGLPDFDPNFWPEAGGMGALTAVGTDLSLAETLLKTKVVTIFDRQQTQGFAGARSGRYVVVLQDLESGKFIPVITNRVVDATGLGVPTIPIKDQATLDLIAKETARVNPLDPDDVPGIQTFTQAVERIGQSEQPFRWAAGKDLVIVGGKDSGKVLNEFFFRLAPTNAYGEDVAQVGQVGRIFWLGVSFEDCKAYINQSRARYSRLAAALNSGKLVPVPGKVSAIRKSRGRKFYISYETPEGRSVADSIEFKTVADARTGQAAGETATFEGGVDHIILATGFRSEAEKVLAPVLGFPAGSDPAAQGVTLKNVLVDVEGKPRGFDEPVAIATRVSTEADAAGRVEPQEIYFIGASNEVRGGLPRKDELKGINDNTVSLFANTYRTLSLAERNAKTAPLGLKPFAELAGTAAAKSELTRARTPRKARIVAAPNLEQFAGELKLPKLPDVELKTRVARILDRFEVPAGTTLELTFKRLPDGNGIGLSVPGLSVDSESALANALFRDAGFLRLLGGYFEQSRSLKRLEVIVPTVNESTSTIREVGIEVLQRLN